MPEPGGPPHRLRHPENPGASPLIQVTDLDKSYAGHGKPIHILSDLQFAVAPGETVALVGPSGIGKSTFLHILGTIDRPDRGELRFGDQNVLLWDDNRLARFRNESIGFVFQFHHLLPEFSTIENTMMPMLIKGVEKAAAREAAEKLLLRMGLKERLHHRVNQLSGGEQQRVALARALVCTPCVVLADEPTGNLDRKNSEQVHEMLVELNREMGIAMIVVTHNPDLAKLMGRRVTLVNGRIQETAE